MKKLNQQEKCNHADQAMLDLGLEEGKVDEGEITKPLGKGWGLQI